MDYTNASDHPAAVLSEAASEFKAAADTLREYERANGVIFAALDRDTLEELVSLFSDEQYTTLPHDTWRTLVIDNAIDLLGLLG